MSSIRTRLACASALALVMAAPSVAQETPWLTPDQPVSGMLEEGDAYGPVGSWSEEDHLYDDYLIRAGPTQRLDISVTSDDFDSYVSIYREGEQADPTPLASDDDGGGYPHALLRFTPDTAGTWRVRVRRLQPAGRRRLSGEPDRAGRGPGRTDSHTPRASRGGAGGADEGRGS